MSAHGTEAGSECWGTDALQTLLPVQSHKDMDMQGAPMTDTWQICWILGSCCCGCLASGMGCVQGARVLSKHPQHPCQFPFCTPGCQSLLLLLLQHFFLLCQKAHNLQGRVFSSEPCRRDSISPTAEPFGAQTLQCLALNMQI